MINVEYRGIIHLNSKNLRSGNGLMRKVGLFLWFSFVFPAHIVLFLVIPSFAQHMPADSKKLGSLIDMGKYQEVINLTAGAQSSPSDPESLYYRGRAYSGLAKRSSAIKDFTEAILLDSRNSDYYIHRGVTFLENGQASEAISDFTAALKLKPDDIAALNQRAKAWMLTGQTAKAMEDINGAIRLASSNPDLYKLRADILSGSKSFEDAVVDYNRAIDLAPYAAAIYNNRAVALANINRPKEAIEDLNSAMELSTTRPNSAASPVFQGSQW